MNLLFYINDWSGQMLKFKVAWIKVRTPRCMPYEFKKTNSAVQKSVQNIYRKYDDEIINEEIIKDDLFVFILCVFCLKINYNEADHLQTRNKANGHWWLHRL